MFLLPHQNRSKKDTHKIEVLLGIMVGTQQIKIQPPPQEAKIVNTLDPKSMTNLKQLSARTIPEGKILKF